MTDRPEMFAPTRGFSGKADSMEPCTMLSANPCCHGNEIWAIFDKIAYKSVCMPDRPDMFGPTGGDDQGADLCYHGNDICAKRGV